MLNRNSTESVKVLRKILKEIVKEKNKEPEDYFTERCQRLVVSSLIYKEAATKIEYLRDWSFEEVLQYPDKKRMREVILAVSGKEPSSAKLRSLADTDLHKDDLKIAADIDSLSSLQSKQALRRYLQMLRQYPELPIRKEDWFINLFNSEKDWVASLALALVARKDYEPTRLFAITSSIFQEKIPELEKGIRLWDHPELEIRPKGWEEVATALNVSNSAVDAYLYYRNLLVGEFSFSKTVLEPLGFLEREEKQIAFLRRRLEEDPSNKNMLKTLERLEDSEARFFRFEGYKANARKTFERSIIKMKRDSFDVVLSNIAAMVLRERYGFKIEKPLTKDFLNAFHLLSADDIDVVLLQRFFKSAIDEVSSNDWPENARYLEAANFQVEVWKAGFDIIVDGFRIHTEHNPMEGLKMGSYFDTCLSLDGGMNAFSALVNVTDANKHVIYARTKSGKVVARQLIAVSKNEELLGYHTYMQSDYRQALGSSFFKVIEQFAEACALPLVDEGEPEKLTSSNWYNDGARDWSAAQFQDQDEKYWERLYVESSLNGDRESLERIAASDIWRWTNFAGYDLREDFGTGWNMFDGRGFYSIGDFFNDPWDNAERTIDQFLSFRGTMKKDLYAWDIALCNINICFASVPPNKLVRALEKYWMLASAVPLRCITEHHENCTRHFGKYWERIFLASFVEGNDVSCVEKLLSHTSPTIRNIGLGVFSQIPVSNATKLRQLLKRATSIAERELLVKALTLSGDARDTLVFKKLFLETPTNAVFAYAILKADTKTKLGSFGCPILIILLLKHMQLRDRWNRLKLLTEF